MIARHIVGLACAASITAGCSDPAPPPAPAPIAPVAPHPTRAVRVTAVEGRAERQAGSSAPRQVKINDELAPDEVIHTDEGAVTLDVAGRADVQIARNTQVAIGELTAKLARVKLRDGRISAVVHSPDAAPLQVEATGSSAVASTDRGEFSMLSTGSQVTVATKSGQVTLSARGKSVTISAGQLSVVPREQAPSAPEAIPSSLFLKVAPTRSTLQRQKQTVVHGATLPGAILSVNGVRVIADPAGAFSATVPLKEGANDLVVESEDVLGRRERAAVPRITVDTKAPAAPSQVEW